MFIGLTVNSAKFRGSREGGGSRRGMKGEEEVKEKVLNCKCFISSRLIRSLQYGGRVSTA